MKVLIDINHPAHVHFFKNLYWKLLERGNEVIVVASNKDITFDLLSNYHIPFINIGSYGKGLFSKLIQLFILDIKMFIIVFKQRPQYILGINTIRGAHAGFLFRNTKVYAFTDTEHAKEQIFLYKYFVDKIFTPSCFIGNLGKKQVRYSGYHELAYLHPNYFLPNIRALTEFKLTPKDTFFILRFVSWEATHDIRQKGMSYVFKKELISSLSKHGKVLITSESELPNEFKQYQISAPGGKIHHLLYYSKMYIGEGGTMASEAAILGTPSLLINSLDAGVFKELENNYHLLKRVTDQAKALEVIRNWLQDKNLNKNWRAKRNWVLKDKINVTKFIYESIR